MQPKMGSRPQHIYRWSEANQKTKLIKTSLHKCKFSGEQNWLVWEPVDSQSRDSGPHTILQRYIPGPYEINTVFYSHSLDLSPW